MQRRNCNILKSHTVKNVFLKVKISLGRIRDSKQRCFKNELIAILKNEIVSLLSHVENDIFIYFYFGVFKISSLNFKIH